MNAIDETVVSKIRAQREHAEVLELWKKLWAAYGSGRAAAVEQVLTGLVKLPSGPGLTTMQGRRR
jgi:hypothetical protein